MKFEEMKKIWDDQNQEILYAINEEALHRHVHTKRKRTFQMANATEILLILVNVLAGGMMLIMNLVKEKGNIFTYLMIAFMFLLALYVWRGRMRRKKSQNTFDRNLLGDLEEAIAVANYQVNLSRSTLFACFSVITLLSLLNLWVNGKSIWLILGVSVFFVLTFLAGKWEHSSIHVARRDSLERMRKKLMED